jgi:hypothetical protein
MYLQEFFDYKNQLMGDLLTNETIVNLLNDYDSHKPAKPDELMYTQVFPFEYIPDAVEHGQTFICCDVDVQKARDKTFYYPTLYVWVFSHKSKLRLPQGGVRTDSICAEIVKMLDGSRFYGLGELEFYSSKRFAPLNDYQGKVLTFNAVDFSKTHPTGKPIPANRKA